jgi:hypothetical protein
MLGPGGALGLTGILHGTEIRLTGVVEHEAVEDSVPCTGGDTIIITGPARRDPLAKRIDATAHATSCAGCAPARFVATRARGYPGRRRP